MELRPLGATGVQVSAIGVGTWQYRGGVEPLRHGIELGATLVDTAEGYGTEDVVGKAIAGRRDGVFLATKVSGDHLRYDEVLRAAKESLKRLGTDRIDLYQVHWPDPRVPIRETMRAMETLADEGKVRFIGVSNFSVAELEQAQAALAKHRIVCNQVIYNLFNRQIEEDLLPYCQRNAITVMAYSPLARGSLMSRFPPRHQRALEVLQRVTQEAGKTVAQVALNWCISKPNVIAIPKSNRAERVAENCAAAGWRLPPEQLRALDQAFV